VAAEVNQAGVPRRTVNALRENTRRSIRQQVAAAAFELFVRDGFDKTTVDQIAMAAGMSRSSFFRYFATKEDVVLGDLDEHGLRLLVALTARPSDEPLWEALQGAFHPLVDVNLRDPDRALQIATFMGEAPSLRARRHEKQQGWQELLRPEVVRRLQPGTHPDYDPRPVALITAPLGCLNAAVDAWVASAGSVPLNVLFDLAMEAVAEP
jgi:AcrR family transcriptional regulator